MATFETTPELQAYLDFNGEGEGAWEERTRLRGLIQPGLLRTYQRAQIDAGFIPANENVAARREKLSPSGKYKLTVGSFGTKPGCWSYTQGKVYRQGSDEPIATVNRNYSAFPYSFVEGHPNGHDYLICGEDYQGQTVIELDTGRRRDHLEGAADAGHGFCWAAHTFDKEKQLLVVDGCLWACPYEYRFFDFSNPMEGWAGIESEEFILADEKPPVIHADGTLTVYQTGDPETEGGERVIEASSTYRLEGLRLVLEKEWVSDAERETRIRREEASQKYELWLKTFRAEDPLYLLMVKLVEEDSAFKPAAHISIGVTHDKWCPHWKGDERRMCRRIQEKAKGKSTLDIEWGVETGPIKLIVYRDGKHVEDKWFEHSLDGMAQAVAYGKAVLS